MTELTIGRLSATVHPIPGFDDPGRRVDRMLRRLADQRLDDRLDRIGLPPGEWCVRRVDVAVAVDPDRAETRIESDWANALLEAIRRVIDTSSSEVVHYRRRSEGLEDLVAGIASGRTERAWAWRQVGLLAGHDPRPETDPAGAIVAALERWPERALYAIVATAARIGVAPLHRLLGEGGWSRLARLTADATGVSEGSVQRLVGTGAAEAPGTRTFATLPIEARARRILDDSTLAKAFRRSGLRPSPSVAASWAVLAVADADPATLRIDAAEALVAEVARALSAADGTGAGLLRASPPASTDGQVRDSPPRSIVTRSAEETSRDSLDAGRVASRIAPDEPTLRDRPAVTDGAEAEVEVADATGLTVWGGLPFLLATADAAGIPDLLDDPRLEARAVRWVMHQLALLLVALANDDPAGLALAGLPPDAQPPSGAAPSDPEAVVLAEAAARWAGVTALALGEVHTDPSEVVATMARRRAEVVGEPGWIEVHLSADDVDVDVRRAGFDLDPGWIPWLGVVMRFVYA